MSSKETKDSPSSWKDAILDQLAGCAMDAPLDEAPESILKRIIDWHVAVALDPAVADGEAIDALSPARSTEGDGK